MRSLVSTISFIALALLCWGLFGPLLQAGIGGMAYSGLRPLVCLGATFSLIATVAPLVWMQTGDDDGAWSSGGILWASLAGVAAAMGTWTVVLAMTFRGNPLYVMPVAFGVMAVVHSLFNAWLRKEELRLGWVFLAAAVLVAIGSAGAIFFSPTADNIAITETEEGQLSIIRTGLEGTKETRWNADSEEQLRTDPELAEAFRLYQRHRPLDFGAFLLVVLITIFTGICWGGFGPLLNRSIDRMEGSRLRPLLVVGLAFLLATVVLPIVVLVTSGEAGGWTIFGTLWSLVAGVVAAAGIVGIVLALMSGGKTSLAMPVVFGIAPLVSIVTSLTIQGSWAFASTVYAVAVALLVGGVVLALLFPPYDGADAVEDQPDVDDDPDTPNDN